MVTKSHEPPSTSAAIIAVTITVSTSLALSQLCNIVLCY